MQGQKLRLESFIQFLIPAATVLFAHTLIAFNAGPENETNSLVRPPSDDEVRYAPDDGDLSATNPPDYFD